MQHYILLKFIKIICWEFVQTFKSSARFICGTQEIHLELEQKIAKMHNAEDAILYAACFDANAGIFEVVLNKVGNHRSISVSYFMFLG